MSAKNLAGNCNISASIKNLMVPKVEIKDNEHSFFSYRMHILIKCLVVALDEIEV